LIGSSGNLGYLYRKPVSLRKDKILLSAYGRSYGFVYCWFPVGALEKASVDSGIVEGLKFRY
jgi:hypothetical protein